jgi:hypothetical protein
MSAFGLFPIISAGVIVLKGKTATLARGRIKFGENKSSAATAKNAVATVFVFWFVAHLQVRREGQLTSLQPDGQARSICKSVEKT